MKPYTPLTCAAVLLLVTAMAYGQSASTEDSHWQDSEEFTVDVSLVSPLIEDTRAMELPVHMMAILESPTVSRAVVPVPMNPATPTAQPITLVEASPAKKLSERRIHGSDRTYWTLAIAGIALTVADYELTQRNMREHPGSRELNPLFGSRPSRSRMYGIGVPLTVAAQVFGWYARRLTRAWSAPQVSVIVGHTIGIVSNTR